MTKVIFLDFWGTLVEQGIKSPSREVQFILRLRDMPFHDYITKFEQTFMTQKYGSLAAAFEAVITTFNLRVPGFVIDKLIGAWNKNTLLAKLYDETIEILEELKKEHKLVLICNTDPFSVPAVLDKYDLRKYFDVIMLSCDTGFLKSDPRSYTTALHQLDADASDAVMIGDSIESDMRSAEQAGIKGILIDRRGKQEYPVKIGTLRDVQVSL